MKKLSRKDYENLRQEWRDYMSYNVYQTLYRLNLQLQTFIDEYKVDNGSTLCDLAEIVKNIMCDADAYEVADERLREEEESKLRED